MGRLSEIADRMEDLRKEVQEQGQDMFKEEAKALFDKYPKLENFTLAGYVDYFNDGDPCTFSMREYLCRVNGIGLDKWAAMDYADEDVVNNIHPEIWGKTGNRVMQKRRTGWGDSLKEWEEEVDETGWIPNPDYDPDFGDLIEELSDLIFKTDPDIFEGIFGSHFIATVTRDGIEVEEYTDHD